MSWIETLWEKIKSKNGSITKKLNEDVELVKSYESQEFAIKCKAKNLKQKK